MTGRPGRTPAGQVLALGREGSGDGGQSSQPWGGAQGRGGWWLWLRVLLLFQISKALASTGHTGHLEESLCPASPAVGSGPVTKLWPTGHKWKCSVEVSGHLLREQLVCALQPFFPHCAACIMEVTAEALTPLLSLFLSVSLELEIRRLPLGQQKQKPEGTRVPEDSV